MNINQIQPKTPTEFALVKRIKELELALTNKLMVRDSYAVSRGENVANDAKDYVIESLKPMQMFRRASVHTTDENGRLCIYCRCKPSDEDLEFHLGYYLTEDEVINTSELFDILAEMHRKVLKELGKQIIKKYSNERECNE